MSELINNREARKETIKNIIKELHEGKKVEDVKGEFEQVFGNVSASEISEAESALFAEGVPIEEIQSLCDVHAAVFKGTIEQIHADMNKKEFQNHPIQILTLENREIEKIISEKVLPNLAMLEHSENYLQMTEALQELQKVSRHYEKKENLLFPYLERYGVTAPPQVMWGIHDEIRTELKLVLSLLTKSVVEKEELENKINHVITKIQEMIFKEENILFPMLMEKLTEDEWTVIKEETSDVDGMAADKTGETIKHGKIQLPTGSFTTEELRCMLNTLPFDLTFVDRNGIVQYFSQGAERIFARNKTVIGREVTNCHPPASVHIVEKIVEDLVTGKKSHEDFWIQMGNVYAYIRYFAVRDEKGEFLGVVEVTQNIRPIQEIQGEKRLAD